MTSTARQTRIANSADFCFNLNVGAQSFELTYTEMESEPGSILFELFGIATSPEGANPRLNADANIFRLIHTHLQGYEIFPLPPQGIPCGGVSGSGAYALPHLSKEATLVNLLRDATDFGMVNLVRKIEREMARQVECLQRAERKALYDDAEAMKGFVVLD